MVVVVLINVCCLFVVVFVVRDHLIRLLTQLEVIIGLF